MPSRPIRTTTCTTRAPPRRPRRPAWPAIEPWSGERGGWRHRDRAFGVAQPAQLEPQHDAEDAAEEHRQGDEHRQRDESETWPGEHDDADQRVEPAERDGP